MYELEIKTKFNTINIIVEDLEDERVQEILKQPYVIEATPKIYTGDINKVKVLKKEKKNERAI